MIVILYEVTEKARRGGLAAPPFSGLPLWRTCRVEIETGTGPVKHELSGETTLC
jgi:hypothetical protein